ncbi:oxidoreductase [Amycolatopsis acidicola]|uniref:Oxidoreductase n=1 Tax=Amycolatopsis acidicola TaxID=2596893 RepID=A0A5N0UW17_9PSEU|nr:PDR/VanB family oxidoreductase [Amycolatopsis acidicola]KAA9156775.1 oxidoreductase [Amycolatopsis acidicola]
MKTGEQRLELKVAKKETIAEGVAYLVLADPDGADLPEWTPGAHIDVELSDEVVRQYSLCGDPDDRSRYEIAVLREPAGRGGSARVHDEVHEGDLIAVRGPRNHFELVDADEYLFIAGGIGITPIMAMVRRAEASGKPWRLVYGGRSRASMAFQDELSATYGDRVLLWPQDESGLIDLEAHLGTPMTGVKVYSCGPEPLLAAVQERCVAWPAGSLHLERFSAVVQNDGESASFEIELAQDGRTLTVPEDRSVVEVLHDAGIDVPVSCREGVCGTCETAVLDGIPDHRDVVLSDEERACNDCMFPCVSRSLTPRLRLDL